MHRAFKTSPVDSLYVDSGLPPLSIRREELSLRYITRALTSKSNPNYKYMKRPMDRAINKPTLPKPLEVRLQNESSNVGILTTPIAQIGFAKTPPWRKPHVEICQAVGGKKSSEIMKREFLKHSNEHQEKNIIYTDGSKSADGVGCAVVAGDATIKKKLPSSCSAFTAEMFAVLTAVKHVFNSGIQGENFLIYTDCSSVLASLRQLMPMHPLVQEVQDWLVLLHSRKRIQVNFCWVPAHVGVAGNEKADKAAKEAIGLLNPSILSVPYGDFKIIIKVYIRNKWQERWAGLQSNSKLKAIRPSIKKWQSSNQSNRRSSIILTRLRIGHSHATHNYLMSSGDEGQAPYCHTCQSQLTLKHILIECSDFNHERRAASLHGKTINEILDDDCDVDNLMDFLKNIDFYYKL